ncbi:Ppx/GppA phosphatase family protein [Magnetospira sp. QH-2]|uniref:Ppx/GppA phosphatase family protein n=1 Tax=Magnetospira sp. (strain QH-2) TaxID=1288970 RepID=UPI0003E80A8A|nr:Ppx/GppA phosphatase family protein [Magnetospira sp. QH-2]CCQ74379.1 putative exopolyphosphatase [Magnetospira sp. QH-2]
MASPIAIQTPQADSPRKNAKTLVHQALYAAIDLGTNNCRLLVAKPCPRGIRVVDSFSRIVRLGEGLTQTGRLSEEAMDRAVEALKICADRIDKRENIKVVRGVATEACRRALNGEYFVGRVKRETGLSLEAITPFEEASLALRGCIPLLDRRHKRALVFDIGGGSTELLWAEIPRRGAPKVIDAISLPHGVVTLTENFDCDPVPQQIYRAMMTKVEGDLMRFDRDHQISEEVARHRVQMLGTSGTVTTLGAVHLKLEQYCRSKVDGLFMDFDDLDSARKLLCHMTCEDRAAIPAIGPGRADLVVAGCAILEALCRRWPVGRLRIADRGIREGLLLGMMTADGYRFGRSRQPNCASS